MDIFIITIAVLITTFIALFVGMIVWVVIDEYRDRFR